ncbi:MAG: response regulator [Proteobacteria bacterium]|nr:response regulator [Pseudomonadota bacterium]
MLNQAMKLEAVGRMTDGIAHDFNNLLTIILGNLQYLKEEIRSPDSHDGIELIADAMSAAYDGANLIKQLLIFSRRQEQVSMPMELSTFMERVQYLLTRTIPEDIVMRLEVAGDIGSVLIDSNRLESAILNLVINARDAMPDGGEIVISIDKKQLNNPEEVEGGHIDAGNYVFIRVADNGSGMSDDVRRQALEPFFTTKPSATGTGLGLSMVHDLILKSGGGIRIESKEGHGTTVILILPSYEQSVESPIRDQGEFIHLPHGTETVLVVEDQEKVRRFARRVLSTLGYRVIEAENAAQALVHLQTNQRIDLLFSDILMPGGMDGRQLAQQASARQPSLKILLTTGMELQAHVDRRCQSSFPLIDKPYSVERLAQSIRSVLNTGELTN